MHLKHLRDLREDFDLSREDVAELLEISHRSYSHYEKGTRQITSEMLRRLAVYYRVSMDYLVGRTDDKRPYSPAETKESIEAANSTSSDKQSDENKN